LSNGWRDRHLLLLTAQSIPAQKRAISMPSIVMVRKNGALKQEAVLAQPHQSGRMAEHILVHGTETFMF